MQMVILETSAVTTPMGMLAASGASALSAQCLCPSRAAPGGPAPPSFDARGAMRRRTITIAAPQQRHCSLGRSLNAGCVDGGMPAWGDAIAAGRNPMRSSTSCWRCLQLGWSRPKLRERRNPLGKTCCNTSHRKCAPPTVRVVFLPVSLSRYRNVT